MVGGGFSRLRGLGFSFFAALKVILKRCIRSWWECSIMGRVCALAAFAFLSGRRYATPLWLGFRSVVG